MNCSRRRFWRVAKRRLGRGIDALLQGRDVVDEQSVQELEREIREGDEAAEGIVAVPIEQLHPNPDQPRKRFDESALAELAASIEVRGVLQPILAEQTGETEYHIVAGERRYRAAQLAGLPRVPVLRRRFNRQEKIEIALIENLHREDLNPLDQAAALRSLQESAGLTQEELAKRLGMNRSSIANSVRLLKLPAEVQEGLRSGRLSAGHARALLALEEEGEQLALYRRVLAEGLSVRQVETLAGDETPGARGRKRDRRRGETAERWDQRGTGKAVELQELEQRLIERFGTRVVLKGDARRGTVEISYLSADDLERVLELLLGEAFRDNA